MDTLRVRFTKKADDALAGFNEAHQLDILYNIQEAARMGAVGRCHKLAKMRRIPGMYRIVCGERRVFCTRYGQTLLITDIVRRREKTYKELRE